jgi:transposase
MNGANTRFFYFLKVLQKKIFADIINSAIVLYFGGVSVAYFLKKSNFKNGLYLQIYESFYNPVKKYASHRSHKALGYVSRLTEDGIPDPIEHFSAVVAQMNAEAKEQKTQVRQIDQSPEKYVGYFLAKSVFDSLRVERYINILQLHRGFHFNICELLSALVYSRLIEPCSKSKTSQEIIPALFHGYDFSYDQILDGVEFLGCEYEKIIEIFNHQINAVFPFDTSITYFDGTNFYFEIDKEDDLRRKGPSKEYKKDPIVGMGLLLDARQIPIGMKLHPGNESEKPVIREVIHDLKARGNITGRTIQVADKGLNCAKNILEARKNKDGYIFTKSVKQLPKTEKIWVLLQDGFIDVRDEENTLIYRYKECVDKFPYKHETEDEQNVFVKLTEKRVVTYSPKLAKKKRMEIMRMVEKAKFLNASKAKKDEYGDCGKYVTFTSADKKGNVTDGKVVTSINQKAIDEDLALSGYNLFVTSEIKMKATEIYATYRNLWVIEECFRILKSYLDARPVFLQKSNSICGHFLICYISIVLIRLLQYNIFNGEFSTEKLLDYMKKFKVVQVSPNKYINLTPTSPLVRSISKKHMLPVSNYFLSNLDIKKVLAHKFRA